MKTLVVFYSKTGNTRKVADKIAKNLGADTDEIRFDEKDFKGPMTKVPADIGFKKDPSGYDMVVIGSPVWGFSIPAPTKSYLMKNKFKKTGFFCTYGLFTGRLFSQMKGLSMEPVAKLKVHMKKVDDCDGVVEEFCGKINASPK